MPAARAAASISLPPGCPGASPSGRLLMTRVMPVVLASARSAGAICPATKVFSSSFLNMPASCGRNSDGVLIGAASRGCNGGPGGQIGRAHVCTPVANEHLVCRLLLEKQHNALQLD